MLRKAKQKPNRLRSFINDSLKAPSRAAEEQYTAEVGNGASEAYYAFMATYRGLECAKCGRKRWAGAPTVGHHILARSVHPEHKLEPKNMIPLCPLHHVPFAHDQPKAFMGWLHDERLSQCQWIMDNKHHRERSDRHR